MIAAIPSVHAMVRASRGPLAKLLLLLTLAVAVAGCNGDDKKKKLAIVAEPADAAVLVGATATFTVEVKGKSPTYQWQKNGAAIAGATSASYTTPATTAADSGGKYSVVVTSGSKSLTSREATLTVNVPPAITTQPANASVDVGATATFSVTATGTAPLAYQWRRNGTNIAGATSASYTTAATVAGDDGAQFSVVVSSPYGTVTSGAATLTVISAPPAFSGTWGSASKLDTLDGRADYVYSAVNRATGDGITAWVQLNGTRRGVYVSEYTAATNTWSAPVELYSAPSDQTSIYSVRVAMNTSGDAVLAWNEYDGNSTSFLRGRRRAPDGTWAPVATATDASVHYVDYVDIAIDDGGQGHVAYVQSGASGPDLATVVRLAPDGGFDVPKVLETATDSSRSEDTSVAVDDFGNLTVAWRRDKADGSGEQVVARRLEVERPWADAVVLADVTGRVDYPDSAVDPVGGQVLVAWNEETTRGAVADIRYTVYDPATDAWSAAAVADADTTATNWVEVGAGDGGIGAIVWEAEDAADSSKTNLRVRRVDLGTGALTGSTTSITAGYFPHVGVDTAGDLLVVYTQLQSSRETTQARYLPSDGGVGTTTQVSGTLIDSLAYNVAMTSDGPAIVSWLQGARDFFGSFAPTDVYSRAFR